MMYGSAEKHFSGIIIKKSLFFKFLFNIWYTQKNTRCHACEGFYQSF